MRTASKSTDLISKIYKFALAAHIFVHFFAVVLHDYSVKLLCYASFFRRIVVCDHQTFCCLCSCSLLFSPPLIFHLLGCQYFSFSHRRYEIFMFFFQRNSSPYFSITRFSFFSVIHLSVDIKNDVEKDSTSL